MNVEILDHSSRMLSTIWVAARTCRSSKTPLELLEESCRVSDDKKISFLKNLKKAGHLSVFEHGSVTFMISGVSRSLLAQITRHRHLSFCVQSQRAVRFYEALSVVAPASCMDENAAIYKEAARLAHETYRTLVDNGVKPEDARFILPEGSCTNMTVTMNLRSFFELYEKRVTANGAQWEIRALVENMKERLTRAEPWILAMFDE